MAIEKVARRARSRVWCGWRKKGKKLDWAERKERAGRKKGLSFSNEAPCDRRWQLVSVTPHRTELSLARKQ